MVPVSIGVSSFVINGLIPTTGPMVSSTVVSEMVPVLPAASVTVMTTVSGPSSNALRSCPETVTTP